MYSTCKKENKHKNKKKYNNIENKHNYKNGK